MSSILSMNTTMKNLGGYRAPRRLILGGRCINIVLSLVRWPLYIIGLVVWLSFIADFTLWIVMQVMNGCFSSQRVASILITLPPPPPPPLPLSWQMLYFGDLTCDSTLEQMTISTIIVRWFMIVSYFVIPINHLCDKIHQENKRKFGRNPYKAYTLKAKKHQSLLSIFGMESGTLEPEEVHGGVGAASTNLEIEIQGAAGQKFAGATGQAEYGRAAPSIAEGPDYTRAQHVV